VLFCASESIGEKIYTTITGRGLAPLFLDIFTGKMLSVFPVLLTIQFSVYVKSGHGVPRVFLPAGEQILPVYAGRYPALFTAFHNSHYCTIRPVI